MSWTKNVMTIEASMVRDSSTTPPTSPKRTPLAHPLRWPATTPAPAPPSIAASKGPRDPMGQCQWIERVGNRQVHSPAASPTEAQVIAASARRRPPACRSRQSRPDCPTRTCIQCDVAVARRWKKTAAAPAGHHHDQQHLLLLVGAEPPFLVVHHLEVQQRRVHDAADFGVAVEVRAGIARRIEALPRAYQQSSAA